MRFPSASVFMDVERLRIEEEVQSLCREVSFKYTPNPSWDVVHSNTITALGRFRDSVRNKAKAYEKKKKEVSVTDDGGDDTDSSDEESVGPKPPNPNDSNGLDTGLRPQEEEGTTSPIERRETWKRSSSIWRSNSSTMFTAWKIRNYAQTKRK
jgi:hypothetical protein